MYTVDTEYGILQGVLRHETFIDGKVSHCELADYNEIETAYGSFVPRYSGMESHFDRMPKRRHSLGFYENGVIKSIALEAQTKLKTPYGIMAVELVTFYESGKLKRVFPRNGQLNGFWSEEDEEKLVKKYDFNFEFGKFKAKIISMLFYPTGEIKSVTLWPGERVKLWTSVGEVDVRIGFSLYKSGKLKSIEPASQIRVATPIGEIWTFDYDAIGVHADANSLKFKENGQLKALKSSANGVVITHSNGRVIILEPREVDSYIDMTETTILPLEIIFGDQKIMFNNGKNYTFDKSLHEFTVKRVAIMNIAACSGCSSCG